MEETVLYKTVYVQLPLSPVYCHIRHKITMKATPPIYKAMVASSLTTSDNEHIENSRSSSTILSTAVVMPSFETPSSKVK